MNEEVESRIGVSADDIYDMGLLAAKAGFTPATLEGGIILGARCQVRGITEFDIADIWRIKVRTIRDSGSP